MIVKTEVAQSQALSSNQPYLHAIQQLMQKGTCTQASPPTCQPSPLQHHADDLN